MRRTRCHQRSSVLQQVWLVPLGEEFEIGAAAVITCNDGLEERFARSPVVLEIAERHLRLDHPELGQVTRRVRILRAESRSEGVDVGERVGEHLRFELSADGEVRGLGEEVLLKSARSCRPRSSVVTWNMAPAPSASERGDQRRVHIDEAAVLEERWMACERVAHTEHRAEGIGARAQMAQRAQRLQVVLLFCSGYSSGSAAPCTVRPRAFNSTAWPFPGDATSSPSTLRQAPVVIWAITSGGTHAGHHERLQVRWAKQPSLTG